jgi:hypothetical protein
VLHFVKSKVMHRRSEKRPCGLDSADSPLRRHEGGWFAFIHINKTAGTSIGRAIGLPRKWHLTVRDVIELVGEERWRQAFRFSVVRNPWDKAVSQYKHRVRTNQTGLGESPISFRQWVMLTHGPEKDPRYYDNPRMFQSQVEWLMDFNGRIDVDLVARFDRLPEDFRQIAARLRLPGLPAELPHLNATEPCDFRTFYDAVTAEAVSRWFAADIDRFGFRFD